MINLNDFKFEKDNDGNKILIYKDVKYVEINHKTPYKCSGCGRNNDNKSWSRGYLINDVPRCWYCSRKDTEIIGYEIDSDYYGTSILERYPVDLLDGRNITSIIDIPKEIIEYRDIIKEYNEIIDNWIAENVS